MNLILRWVCFSFGITVTAALESLFLETKRGSGPSRDSRGLSLSSGLFFFFCCCRCCFYVLLLIDIKPGLSEYSICRESNSGLQRKKKVHRLKYMDINHGHLHYTEFYIIRYLLTGPYSWAMRKGGWEIWTGKMASEDLIFEATLSVHTLVICWMMHFRAYWRHFSES